MINSNFFKKIDFSKDDIVIMLNLASKEDLELLREQAYSVMKEQVGENVYYRGLIEFSNYCINDCLYCGIRKSNPEPSRYILSKEEIVSTALWCAERGYGSVVLQSGERSDDEFIEFVIDTVKEIKQKTISDELPEGLGITLSIGNQSLSTYKSLFEAGAHRYLLRIESSSIELFENIHPPELSYQERLECLKFLKKAGFQVGTGIMIGIPGQTIEQLAEDILFFKEHDIDMVGMGPYIPHSSTPMGKHIQNIKTLEERNYELSLKMIAIARIVLKDVNIASTTALQAIKSNGREEGLMHGANIIMPLLTPTGVRKQYLLYDGKPCVDELAQDCDRCLRLRIESIGRDIAINDWGDSKHFRNKKI